ncbi:MAG: hydantoinase B/oxoprolinase family protein, partial [Rhodospirillaceae bacterium]|nr:hydantoinase B/oxoprolinase family protein [Rhodospirillaceae bacterium]
GLQIPILKLYEAGQPNETLFSVIRQNVRVADEVMGDIHAMVGACERIQSGLDRLLSEYGMVDISGITSAIVDLTERSMRRAILAIPDGVYKSVTPIDTFDTTQSLTIACAMTIEGDQIFVDFDGSSPQNDSPLNSVLGYTQAYSIYAIKCLLQPDIANNEGGAKPITITAPAGCFLNPRYPAAVEARATVGHYCTSAIFNTLAEAIPDRVPAESGIPLHGFALSGQMEGKPFSTIFFFNGGQGARPGSDGISTLSFPTNVSTTPVELLERALPIRIAEKSFVLNSGGAGQFRGGMGQRIALEVTGAETVYAVLLSQRLKYPPRGRQGGEDGAVEKIILNGENVEANKPFRLSPGDVLVLELPGGGGYGRAVNS